MITDNTRRLYKLTLRKNKDRSEKAIEGYANTKKVKKKGLQAAERVYKFH
jgi:hypothetical protein